MKTNYAPVRWIILILFIGVNALLAKDIKPELNAKPFALAELKHSTINRINPLSTILLEEGFESTIGDWFSVDGDSDGYTWTVYQEGTAGDGTAHTGTMGIGVVYNASGNDDWLITPELTLPAGESASFSFWAHSQLSSFLESFNVMLSNGSSSVADFTVTLGSVVDAPSDWTLYTYDLSGYAGQSIRLAIQCVSVNEYYLFADDFFVETSGTTQSLNADFTADVTSGTAPLTVNFTDASTGSPNVWQWDFNDDTGVDDYAQNPTYTYNSPGTYPVTLFVHDGTDSDMETKVDYITVNATSTLTAGFSATPLSGTAPLTVNFLDESAGATSWSWDFDNDGTADATTQNPSYTFNAAGTYTVALTVSDGTNNDTVTKTDYIVVNTETSTGTWVSITSAASGDFRDVFFIGDIGWAVGYESGKVFKTIDKGETWSDVRTDTDYSDIDVVCFTSTTTGFIAENFGGYLSAPATGKVMRTTDGGATWSLVFDITDAEFQDIAFADANNGWAVSGSQIFKTTDGGTNWAEQTATTVGYRKISIIDANNVHISTGPHLSNQTVIVKTTNGGTDWVDVIVSGTTLEFLDIDFVSNTQAWASGWNGKIFKTTDGVNYTVIETGYSAGLNYLDFVNDLQGIVVSASGLILRTEDGGTTWTEDEITNDGLLGIFYIDDATAVAIGYNGTILKYSNGNNSSNPITAEFTATPSYGTIPLTVAFTDASVGATSWSWDFDNDGSEDATIQNPSYIYTVAGAYSVSLTVSDGATSSTEVKNNYIVAANVVEPGDLPEGWSWQNPQPQGNHLESLFTFDANNIIAVGESGTVAKSIDGGASWYTQAVETSTLESVYFVDSNTGWICSYAGKIYKTTDGGTHWIEQTIATQGPLMSIHFVDANTGWAVGYWRDQWQNYHGTVFKTTDGGNSWAEQTSGTSNKLMSVYFTDSNTGWAVGQYTIRKTTDGGTTWTDNTNGFTRSVYLYSVNFLDANTGWTVGETGTIYKTTDGGANWVEKDYGHMHRLNSVEFTDSNTGWVVGSYGDIYHTTDGGDNWAQQTAPTDEALGSVSFVDANNGWAIGSYANILRTTDGGVNWTQETKGSIAHFEAISFISDNVGWAAGEKTVVMTNNGGQTWTDLETTGLENAIYSIYFIDPNTGWSCGLLGKIYKTTDGGLTWTLQTSQGATYMYDIVFTDANIGYAIGGSGMIMKTTDGGSSWTSQTSNSSHDLYGVHFIDSNTGWVSGYGGTLLKTVDGGTTWNLQTTGSTRALESVHFTDANNGWTVGQSATLLKTTDGGTSWTAQTSESSSYLYSVFFVDANTGWVAGAAGTILQTVDGGANWISQPSGTSNDLKTLYFSDSDIGWATGDNGTIIKTISGGIIGVDQNAYAHTGLPQTFSLKQNYPNPFNPSTQIAYELYEQSYVVIRIFDIRGQEVFAKHLGMSSPGIYHYQWQSTLNSGLLVNGGMYFLQMQAGQEYATIKMLYLKQIDLE